MSNKIKHCVYKVRVFRITFQQQKRLQCCATYSDVNSLYFECKTPVTPEWRPYSVPKALKKLQNAEVRAVQTPATLCKRCANAVQSPRMRL